MILENELKSAASNLYNDTHTGTFELSKKITETQSSNFKAMALINEKGEAEHLNGFINDPPNLTDREIRALRSGEVVITTKNSSHLKPKLYMLKSIKDIGKELRNLVGEIDLSYLLGGTPHSLFTFKVTFLLGNTFSNL